MIAILCGGRTYICTEADYAWLASLSLTEVVTGGAKGADLCGHLWAQGQGIETAVFPANWKGYMRSAGPRRNAHMLAYLRWRAEVTGARHAVLAFPGGSGTADMCRQARAAGVPVLHVPRTAP